MKSALLVRANRHDALANIARCGGLVAARQFYRFLQCNIGTGRQIWRQLEAQQMVRVIKPNRNVILILLTKATVEALRKDLPTPPQRTGLRMPKVHACLARAEYFLEQGNIAWPMTDLVSRWGRGQTKGRVAAAVRLHVKEWHAQAISLRDEYKRAPTEALADKFKAVRRRIRDPSVITAAGMHALKYKRGLHIVESTGPQIRFVFVDRVSTGPTFAQLIEVLSRFSAATAMDTHLDIVCGAQRDQQRVNGLLVQGHLRVTTRVLNLGYHRYTGMTTALPPLVRERLPAALTEGGR